MIIEKFQPVKIIFSKLELRTWVKLLTTLPKFFHHGDHGLIDAASHLGQMSFCFLAIEGTQ